MGSRFRVSSFRAFCRLGESYWHREPRKQPDAFFTPYPDLEYNGAANGPRVVWPWPTSRGQGGDAGPAEITPVPGRRAGGGGLPAERRKTETHRTVRTRKQRGGDFKARRPSPRALCSSGSFV